MPESSLLHHLEQVGPEGLTVPELLALILRTGSDQNDALALATQLLDQHGGLRALARLEYSDWLLELRPVQAAAVLAALELARRLPSEAESPRASVHTAADAAQLLALAMERHKQEHLRVILLDAQRRVLTIPTVYIGSLALTVVRTAEVFREALARNAASVILAHNHPSGDPTPSPEDLDITEHLVKAGRLLDIAVLDHLIIGHGRWVSLRESGLSFD
jgi:DNA repair protein RadC